jgi:hypothetical protein
MVVNPTLVIHQLHQPVDLLCHFTIHHSPHNLPPLPSPHPSHPSTIKHPSNQPPHPLNRPHPRPHPPQNRISQPPSVSSYLPALPAFPFSQTSNTSNIQTSSSSPPDLPPPPPSLRPARNHRSLALPSAILPPQPRPKLRPLRRRVYETRPPRERGVVCRPLQIAYGCRLKPLGKTLGEVLCRGLG